MLARAWQLLRPTASTLTAPLRPFSAPCVHDSLVRFYVIDADGTRHQVQGLAGRSVAQAMHESGIFTEFDAFTYSPDIPVPDAHVYVGREHAKQLGAVSPQEQVAINMCAESVRPNSRMAAYLQLDRNMSDLVIAQAPNLPQL